MLTSNRHKKRGIQLIGFVALKAQAIVAEGNALGSGS